MYSALFPTLSRRMQNQPTQQTPNIWTYLICGEVGSDRSVCDLVLNYETVSLCFSPSHSNVFRASVEMKLASINSKLININSLHL